MPVKFEITGVSSNKQEENGKKVGVEGNRYCYSPIKGGALLKPVIDRISIVYKIIDSDLTAAVVEALLLETEAGGNYSSHKQFKNGAVKYVASAILTMPHNGSQALIQAEPQKKTVAHNLRLEFNPRALGGPGMDFLKYEIEALQVGGLNFQDIATNGKITRVDVAVDLIGIGIHDLIFRCSEGGKSHCYFSEAGQLETGYFGLKDSNKNCPWVAYDKKQQLLELQEELPYGGNSYTRIEYHSKLNIKLASLPAMKNPFCFFSVAYAKTPNGTPTHVWQHFLDSCRHRGVDRALELMPPGPRKALYSETLNLSHEAFWKPAVIWAAWPEAVFTSGLI